jgi:hypothetical protein
MLFKANLGHIPLLTHADFGLGLTENIPVHTVAFNENGTQKGIYNTTTYMIALRSILLNDRLFELIEPHTVELVSSDLLKKPHYFDALQSAVTTSTTGILRRLPALVTPVWESGLAVIHKIPQAKVKQLYVNTTLLDFELRKNSAQ